MKHKQDRHNCSLLLNLKLFITDLSVWRIHVSGNHLPPESGVTWQPPPPQQQKMGEDAKDVIFKYYGKESNANIAELLVKENQLKGHDHNTSKKRVSYFVSSMKKRRRERNYNLGDPQREKTSKSCSTSETVQSETKELTTHVTHVRQLSDQQIIDVLRDEADGESEGYTILNPVEFRTRTVHLQPNNTELVYQHHPNLIIDTSREQPSQPGQETHRHRFTAVSHSTSLPKLETVSAEKSVIIALNTNQSTEQE